MSPQKIKNIRSQLGLNQREFGELLGLSSQPYISSLENGVEKPGSTLRKHLKLLKKVHKIK